MSAVILDEYNPNGDNIVVIPTGGGSDQSHFEGLTPEVINQGTDFDLTDGVKAFDKDGNEVEFSVSPSEIEPCEIGNQTFTYTAGELTQNRIITVQAISNPTISGLSPLTVEVGEEFDPLDGVTAEDGNGNPATVTYEAPTPSNIVVDEDLSAPIELVQWGETGGLPLTQMGNLNAGDTIRITLSNAVLYSGSADFVVDGGDLVFELTLYDADNVAGFVTDFTTTPDYSNNYASPYISIEDINTSMNIKTLPESGELNVLDGIRASHILIERVNG